MRTCDVGGCERKHKAEGLCSLHYNHMKRKHMKGIIPAEKLAKAKEKFNSSYMPVTETGCWIWMGRINCNGYGNVEINYNEVRAHRLSWMIHYGLIPKGLYVLHKCDVRCCVNPEHLWLGTYQDNSNDAVKKGRLHSKLTWEDVREIRKIDKQGMLRKHIAKKFNVHPPCITKICNNLTWKVPAGAGPYDNK